MSQYFSSARVSVSWVVTPILGGYSHLSTFMVMLRCCIFPALVVMTHARLRLESTISTHSMEESLDSSTDQLPVNIGKPPFEDVDLKSLLPQFSGVYAKFLDHFGGDQNEGGTGFMHAFYLWTLCSRLNVTGIIESGAHRGLGTSSIMNSLSVG